MPHTRVLGHRGGSGEAPENTARAFVLAAEQGADGIELDIQPSADGVPVVMHDETVDRTTNGQGRVDVLSAATLTALDAGQGERVPTLAEALDLARGRLFMDIEIKDRGVEPAIANLIARRGMADQVAISSFYPASLAAMRTVAPHLPRWLLSVHWSAETLETARELGVVGVAPHASQVDAAMVELARQHDLQVITWTVNQPSQMSVLFGLGIDWLITDFPARAVRLRGENHARSAD